MTDHQLTVTRRECLTALAATAVYPALPVGQTG